MMTSRTKRWIRVVGFACVGLCIVVFIGSFLFLRSPAFGSLPDQAHAARIQQSPNYRDGQFQNQRNTPIMATDKSRLTSIWEFLTIDVPDLIPRRDIPVIKTDFNDLPLDKDLLVWLGHSSLYAHLHGQRILVDPVLVSASPLSFINQTFPGTSLYRPEDIPPIDVLLITHDHWDHLDYETMILIKDRVRKVVCPLGVGAHLASWGFSIAKIHELDWYQHCTINDTMQLTALPARHFSGRGLTANQTLWSGFMVQGPFGNILLSGDTGYDTHFQEIKRRFGTIDLAILENGQYHEDWRYIHMMPDDLIQAIEELSPKNVLTVHHSKYALARHPWYEPMEKVVQASKNNNFQLMTPKIGEVVFLADSTQTFSPWWQHD
ncbi:MBL fold metallo-hydrolase [Sphingobacterium suaedae]|uniref:MBL fold metallo-hydrolase n=1 Tax=Sphingobacterium suaedae TaxID=1686402 RepID=A0ABW5KL55_9SPHI